MNELMNQLFGQCWQVVSSQSCQIPIEEWVV